MHTLLLRVDCIVNIKTNVKTDFIKLPACSVNIKTNVKTDFIKLPACSDLSKEGVSMYYTNNYSFKKCG